MLGLKNLKRGQITIFVILGIIIVVVGAFLFFNSKIDIFMSNDTKVKNQVSDIVEDCIELNARQGVFLLGYQAGYINISPKISVNPNYHLDLGMKIPNWDSNRVDDIPTIESMQEELNYFLKKNIFSCVQSDLGVLTQNFDFDLGSDMKVETKINDENIVVDVDYYITFNEINSNEVLSVSDFYVRLDNIRLGDLYNLAVQIYNREEESYFLENNIVDQIYSASNYNSDYSMPTEGMYFSCRPKIWTIEDLKQILANLNNHNFRYLQIEGTYPKTGLLDLEVEEKFHAYYENFYSQSLDSPKASFENYYVDFVMPSAEYSGSNTYFKSYPYRKFEVSPNDGQIVKATSLEIDDVGKIPIPCIQIYHHMYDLDYDILVKLTDRNDDSSGFFFQFPLRVEIENNNPKQKISSIITTKDDVNLATNEAYCDEETFKYPLRVHVIDSITNEYLPSVNISYECLNLKCSNLGQTNYPELMGYIRKNAPAEYKGEFPYCYGGNLIAKKAGYHTSKLRVDTDESLIDKDVYYDLYLTPLLEFGVDEGNFLLIDSHTNKGSRVYENSDASIYVTIENNELDFQSTAIWPYVAEGYYDKLYLLEDLSVSYNVSVIYVDENGDLKGLMSIKDWKPDDLYSGDELEFTVPIVSGEMSDDIFLEYYQEVENLVSRDSVYNIDANYGIEIR